MKARRLNDYFGRRMYRWPVRITFGELASLNQVNCYPRGVVHVIASSAREACDLLTDELGHVPCVELDCFGPRGGVAAHRYWGWDRALFLTMDRERDHAEVLARQLQLFETSSNNIITT